MRKSGKTAGILLFLSGFFILMGIITGEIFYPVSYSTAQNTISDLGGTIPPNSVIYQPSATIFNLTMIITGIMILLAFYFLFREEKLKKLIPLGMLGVGILGVGIFPGNVSGFHPLFALISFIFGGIAVIVSSRMSRSKAFRLITSIMGIIALASLVIAIFLPNIVNPFLGDGGIERWVAYPIVLWLCIFGGYLVGSSESSK